MSVTELDTTVPCPIAELSVIVETLTSPLILLVGSGALGDALVSRTLAEGRSVSCPVLGYTPVLVVNA